MSVGDAASLEALGQQVEAAIGVPDAAVNCAGILQSGKHVLDQDLAEDERLWRINYRGTLIDGKEFDSSYSRGEPATFGVSQVIKGWTEALQLMTTGAKWMLYIPSELAYGERGAGGSIGPNSTLIFEVELIAIM